jgi:hypothetical protein
MSTRRTNLEFFTKASNVSAMYYRQFLYHFRVLRNNVLWLLFRSRLYKPQNVDRRIVISLTSYPARFEYLAKTLKTLMIQTTSPNAVRVYIEEKDFPQIGPRLLRFRKLGVTFCPTVSGWRAATKLIPEILRDEAKEDLILYLDDEIIYPRNLVASLVHTLDAWPDSDVVFNWGQIVPLWDANAGCIPKYSTWKTTNLVSPEKNLVVPLGVAGVLLKRASVPVEVSNFVKFQEISQSNDDLWYWFHFIQNNLKLVRSFENFESPIYWRGSQEQALWKTNIIQGENDNIIKRMMEKSSRFQALILKSKAV